MSPWRKFEMGKSETRRILRIGQGSESKYQRTKAVLNHGPSRPGQVELQHQEEQR